MDCSAKDSPVVDSNFGAVVGFTPPEFLIPSANDLPIGALAGRLTSEATLGILNNACNVTINVSFTMMNASVDINNTIDPKPATEDDVFEPLAADANANGIPDGVDRYPSFLNETFNNTQPRSRLFGITFIQGAWVPLNFVFFEPGVTLEAANRTVTFDPALGVPSVTVLNNPEAPPQPSAVSDFCAPLLSDNIAFGQTVDNPCTPTPVAEAACPPNGIADRGYPLFPCEVPNAIDEDGDGVINDGCPQVNSIPESGADCNNNTSDDGEDTAINDGCPQVGDQSENERLGGDCSGGDEGGCIYRQNPSSAGDVLFTTLSVSLRDHDGDGIENSLDVCWDDSNPDWNPRANDPENDPDGDGLANECDPEPDTASGQNFAGCVAGIVGPDEDLDCFSNRADNCPLVNQLEDPSSPPHEVNNLPIATDSDSDGIGDACDSAPNDPDAQGVPAFICLEMTLGVGGGATKGVASYNPNMGLDCATTMPTPTPAPTPTPVRLQGDVDCSRGVGAVDALKILRFAVALPYGQTEPCPEIGEFVGENLFGDVDCSGGVGAVDALKILRFVIALPYGQTEPCPDLSEVLP